MVDTSDLKFDIKKGVEAILFAAGKAVPKKELVDLLHVRDVRPIKKAVAQLKEDLDSRDSPLMIVEEDDGWKLTLREAFLPLVQNINPHTELSKSILETLAVIAWKQPVLQSDVIKVRTNKAYDHIAELEKLGFVTKERHGRSYALRVTPKFMEYFDLPDDKAVKELFKGFKDIELAVQKKVDDFENEIPEGDKAELQSHTESDIKRIADEVAREELGMEPFDDTLPPVDFPAKKPELEIYTAGSSTTDSSQQSADQTLNSSSDNAADKPTDDKPADNSDAAPVDKVSSGGASVEDKLADVPVSSSGISSVSVSSSGSQDKDSSAQADTESEAEKAKRIATELLAEDSAVGSSDAGVVAGKDAVKTHDLHPELEDFISETSPEEVSKSSGKSKDKKTNGSLTQKTSDAGLAKDDPDKDGSQESLDSDSDQETDDSVSSNVSDTASHAESSVKTADKDDTPSDSLSSGSQDSDRSDDSDKPLPAEEYPGQFDAASEGSSDVSSDSNQNSASKNVGDAKKGD